ncbi:MAG: hypothetical protein KGL39_42635 [Patescibacteria group bacterium]|nr:hypothetical protein [Patescibacteria group bacterium]
MIWAGVSFLALLTSFAIKSPMPGALLFGFSVLSLILCSWAMEVYVEKYQ